jgi:protein O-mannosyl-transferase
MPPVPRRHPQPLSRAPRWPWALGLLLLVVTAFAGVRNNGFINFDDPQYITQNVAIADGWTRDGIAWSFTTTHAGNWHPITWLSHMIDVELFGMDPREHHLMSVAMHGISAVLLFVVLARLTGSPARSGVVAALFAVHPLRVESVAWAAERKDVLGTVFWMLTLYAYARYTARSTRLRYAAVVGAFTLGLMSKPMLVTLPATLLLLDLWPLRRHLPLRALVIEKLPLLGLSAASAIVTLLVQRAAGAVRDFDVLPLGTRIGNAVVSYTAYLGKLVWPVDLAPLYPYRNNLNWQLVAASLLVLVAISALVWRARRRAPYLAVGWAWYLVTLLPVIGIIQVGSQSMADRYTYVPSIGLLLAAVWGLADAAARRLPAAAPAAGAAAVLVALTAATVTQVERWRTPVELWTHTIAVTEDNARAQNNLGHALVKAGRPAEAEQALRESVRLEPSSAESRNNLGVALAERGRHSEAIQEYAAALQLRPAYVDALVNLGIAQVHAGEIDDGVRRLEEAARLRPDPDVRRNLASALTDAGLARARKDEWTAALDRFEQAIRADPGAVNARNNAGVAAERLGRTDAAIEHYREAMRLAPSAPDAHLNLGRLLARHGRDEEALLIFFNGLRASPRDADLHAQAALILARRGRLAEAARHFEAALASNPAHPAARAGLVAVARALEKG